jgi:hypothetical protein
VKTREEYLQHRVDVLRERREQAEQEMEKAKAALDEAQFYEKCAIEDLASDRGPTMNPRRHARPAR